MLELGCPVCGHLVPNPHGWDVLVTKTKCPKCNTQLRYTNLEQFIDNGKLNRFEIKLEVYEEY